MYGELEKGNKGVELIFSEILAIKDDLMINEMADELPPDNSIKTNQAMVQNENWENQNGNSLIHVHFSL